MKLILLLSLLSFGAYAKVQTFTLEGGKTVMLNVKEDWETAKELFGIPLAVLGPWANESRPVLSVLPTKLKQKDVSESEFKKLFEDFKKEKQEWVESHSGELVNYEPVTSVEFNKNLLGHYIGAEFKINNIHFIERSYYLYCNGEVYNLKYSMRDEHRKYTKDLQNLVEGFKCE